MTARTARSRWLAVSATLAATLALGTVAPAAAQTWPSRTIKLVLPLGPGSGADIGARLVADRLNKAWGQPVVVENRPGGDPMVAIGAFITANEDHTFLWAPSSTFVAHPFQHAKVPYDRRDIVPVARVSNTIVSFTVPVGLPVKSLKELVAMARAEPGKLNWASVTGLNDMLFQSFVKDNALAMVRVPYRDAVQAANDVSEGRVQAYTSAYAIARPQVQAGKLRVIAVLSTQQAPMLPGVPTVREEGFPTLEFDGMVGIYATRIVPEALRDRISKDVLATLSDPVIRDRLTATGQVVNPGDAKQFAAAIDAQAKLAAAAAKILGIKEAQ